MKHYGLTLSSLQYQLNDFLSEIGIESQVMIRAYQDFDMDKIVINVTGNFKTVEDVIDECWENNS